MKITECIDQLVCGCFNLTKGLTLSFEYATALNTRKKSFASHNDTTKLKHDCLLFGLNKKKSIKKKD